MLLHTMFFTFLCMDFEGTNTSDAGYSGPLMGILVVQDVQLGALIAMIPLLCFQTASGIAFSRLLRGVVILCITILCFLLLCRIVSLFVIDRLFRFVMCYTDTCTHECTHHIHTCIHIRTHMSMTIYIVFCVGTF